MKRKKYRFFKILLLLISISLIVISSVNIFNWHKDNLKTKEIIEVIENITTVEEILDNTNTEIIEQKEEEQKNSPYWNYIKMNLINVDFNELKGINKDTVGWIQVNGTNINYPFVQTTDNSYYLTHSFDKKYTDAGWVFLDYRNNIKDFDKNTIIYAHARKDKTMFGSLKNILKSGWLDDTNNYVIKLSTENENTLWQIFSIYHIPTTNDYIKVKFNDDNEFLEFLNLIKNRSKHNFNTNLSDNDKILTLSTCYTNNEKLVLHAKLIKKEIK